MELNRDQAEFLEKLYKELRIPLWRYSFAILHSEVLAEEVLQEVFLIACAKGEILYENKNPERWLFLVTKNVVRNMQRSIWREKRNRSFFDDCKQLCIEQMKESNEFAIKELFGDILSANEINLLNKIVLKKYTCTEVAEELNISEEACKKRLQRVRQKIKNKKFLKNS